MKLFGSCFYLYIDELEQTAQRRRDADTTFKVVVLGYANRKGLAADNNRYPVGLGRADACEQSAVYAVPCWA